MPPCLAALNSQISVATASVRPPLKSAQVKKISSVTVIAASPGTLACDEPGRNIVVGRREAATR